MRFELQINKFLNYILNIAWDIFILNIYIHCLSGIHILQGILYSVRQPQRQAGSSVLRWGSMSLGGAQRRAPTWPWG